MTFSVLGRGPGNHGYEPRTVWDRIQSPIATDISYRYVLGHGIQSDSYMLWLWLWCMCVCACEDM